MAYRELEPPLPHIACVWIHDADPGPRAVRVLPDACADLVWGAGRLLIAGPATRAVESAVPAGALTVGVRLRIGAAGAALGLPADELLDRTLPAGDVWGRAGAELAERVALAPTPAAKLRTLATAVAPAEPDRLVRAAALGYDPAISERQLRRRFAAAVGYGPATLRRILRFQRFLALARAAAAPDLARLALDAGYADQAHLTREVRRLSGLTPAALLAAGAGPAGERAVSFKTPRPATRTLAA